MLATLTATISANSPIYGGKTFTVYSYEVPPEIEGVAGNLLAKPLIAVGSVTVDIKGGTVTFTPQVSESDPGWPPFDKTFSPVSENIGVLGGWILGAAVKSGTTVEATFTLLALP